MKFRPVGRTAPVTLRREAGTEEVSVVIYECDACGAAVTNRDWHRIFHDRVKQATSPPRSKVDPLSSILGDGFPIR